MEITCKGSGSEIYGKLKAKITELQNQGKAAQIKDLNFDDASQTASASGTGFKANMKCADGKVIVDLDLNLFLKPMRGQIEETIQKMVSKAVS